MYTYIYEYIEYKDVVQSGKELGFLILKPDYDDGCRLQIPKKKTDSDQTGSKRAMICIVMMAPRITSPLRGEGNPPITRRIPITKGR